jgi:hypothetical protein
MTTSFGGTERLGIEITGTIPKDAANDCAGGGLSVDATGGVVPVSIVLLSLQDVHADAFAAFKRSWTQVLWRVGVRVRDKPAWLLFKVDVDAAVPRAAMGWLMSFPTRAAALHVKDSARQVDVVVASGDQTLLVRVELHTATPSRAQDKKKLVLRHGARFYEAPWGHDAPTSRVAGDAKVSVQDLAEETFGHGAAWDEEAVVWRDRAHRCGRAMELPVV